MYLCLQRISARMSAAIFVCGEIQSFLCVVHRPINAMKCCHCQHLVAAPLLATESLVYISKPRVSFQFGEILCPANLQVKEGLLQGDTHHSSLIVHNISLESFYLGK